MIIYDNNSPQKGIREQLLTARDRCQKFLPRVVLDALKESAGNAYVAGGFCRDLFRDETPNDIDIFFSCLRAHDNLLDYLNTAEEIVYRALSNCTVVDIWKFPKHDIEEFLKIYLFRRGYYKDVNSLLSSFDFTCCQAAFWYDPSGAEFVFSAGDSFIADARVKTLNYAYPERNGSAADSFMRMLRFLRRGWWVSDDTVAAVLSRALAKLSGKSVEDLEKALAAMIARRGMY